jgi:sensor histidine kinase YesM
MKDKQTTADSENKSEYKFYSTRMLQLNALIFIIVIFFIASIAIVVSYNIEFDKLLKSNREAVKSLYDYYDETHREFYTIFISGFSDPDAMLALKQFMQLEEIDVNTRNELIKMYSFTVSQHPDIHFVILYRELDNQGFLYSADDFDSFIMVDNSFPFIDELKNKKKFRESYATKYVTLKNYPYKLFAIAGNAYNYEGSVLVAFDVSPLNAIYSKYDFKIPTRMLVTSGSYEVIYDSENSLYGDKFRMPDLPADSGFSGKLTGFDGKDYYVETLVSTDFDFSVISVLPWKPVCKAAHSKTYLILLTAFILGLFSFMLYIRSGNKIKNRVEIITDSLEKMANPESHFRIPDSDKKDEFGKISSGINEMTDRLEQSMQKVYEYQIRQKTAELGELQSKLNPHFLYNTLEIIEGELLNKGDIESSQMLVLLSRIFHQFIQKKQFATIREEIAFCNTYFELFRLRFPDSVAMEYHVETSILDFSIIKNLLQPIIENYFIHGFDQSKKDNRLNIQGEHKDNTIYIKISDNGLGMEPERLKKIKYRLMHSSSDMQNEGYGLYNIDRRIKNICGQEYGLTIDNNHGGGTTVTLKIIQMTQEQYQKKTAFPKLN